MRSNLFHKKLSIAAVYSTDQDGRCLEFDPELDVLNGDRSFPFPFLSITLILFCALPCRKGKKKKGHDETPNSSPPIHIPSNVILFTIPAV
jgi:hypothetical protein